MQDCYFKNDLHDMITKVLLSGMYTFTVTNSFLTRLKNHSTSENPCLVLDLTINDFLFW